MKKKQGILVVFLCAIMMVGWIGTAWGHAAIVWAYVEKGQVHVEAFFASGAKLQNTTVVIVDENGDVLLEGKTDSEGNFSYKPVSKDAQTVIVKAGDSHIGDFELSTEDLADIILE